MYKYILVASLVLGLLFGAALFIYAQEAEKAAPATETVAPATETPAPATETAAPAAEMPTPAEVKPVVKPKLAVLDFKVEDVNVSPIAFADNLIAVLDRMGNFNVIEREQLNAIIREQGLSQSGLVSQTDAIQIGKLRGIDLLVAGSIGRLGTLIIINARFIDIKSSEVIATFRVDGVSEDAIPQMANELAEKIKDAFTEEGVIKTEKMTEIGELKEAAPPPVVEATPPPAPEPTPAPQAVKLTSAPVLGTVSTMGGGRVSMDMNASSSTLSLDNTKDHLLAKNYTNFGLNITIGLVDVCDLFMKAGYSSGSNLYYWLTPGDTFASVAGANYGGGLKFGLMREASDSPFSLTASVGYQGAVTTVKFEPSLFLSDMEYSLSDIGGGLEVSKFLDYNQAPYLQINYHSYTHSVPSTYAGIFPRDPLSTQATNSSTEIALGYIFALADGFAIDIGGSSISYTDNPFAIAAQAYTATTYGIKLAVSF